MPAQGDLAGGLVERHREGAVLDQQGGLLGILELRVRPGDPVDPVAEQGTRMPAPRRADLARGGADRFLVAAARSLLPEVDAVDPDGEHQAMMMLVIKRRVAEDVVAAQGRQLADIGLDLVGREDVVAEGLGSGLHDPLVGRGPLHGERALGPGGRGELAEPGGRDQESRHDSMSHSIPRPSHSIELRRAARGGTRRSGGCCRRSRSTRSRARRSSRTT